MLHKMRLCCTAYNKDMEGREGGSPATYIHEMGSHDEEGKGHKNNTTKQGGKKKYNSCSWACP